MKDQEREERERERMKSAIIAIEDALARKGYTLRMIARIFHLVGDTFFSDCNPGETFPDEKTAQRFASASHQAQSGEHVSSSVETSGPSGSGSCFTSTATLSNGQNAIDPSKREYISYGRFMSIIEEEAVSVIEYMIHAGIVRTASDARKFNDVRQFLKTDRPIGRFLRKQAFDILRFKKCPMNWHQECREERCAWWEDTEGRCGVFRLVDGKGAGR